ncbi:MAG: CorA family divalent cation transporter [Candidatus Paceibacterota bacterium]|jgi:magnesium transporter
MMKRYIHKGLVWIDLESPTTTEVQGLMKEFEIYPHVAQELLLPTFKPKVDLYKNFIYLILHFPVFKHSHNQGTSQEIDFIIGKNFVITTRYDTVDSVHRFSKSFEVNSILDKDIVGDHAGYIFYGMISELYKSLLDELDFIKDSLSDIEEKIFTGKEREMVMDLSKVSRTLLTFHHTTGAHKNVLLSLQSAGKKFFGEEFTYPLQEIMNEYGKIEHAISVQMESLREMRETNNSLLETKQNEVMKVLTLMSFISMPFAIIAGFYSMDLNNTPFVSNPNSFWLVIGIMCLFSIVIIVMFKKRKWF